MSIFSRKKDSGEYTIAGKKAACPHCGGSHFHLSSSQLHSQGMTFFQLEWLDKNAFILICDGCSHVDWFAKKPESLPAA